MKRLKVMLVDDEILAINHIKSLIAWEDYGFEIVAESTNPVKALYMLKKTSPDIVIVDIRMPVMDGLEFGRRLMLEGSQAKILLLTSYKDFEYAKQALELGVSNYLLKHETHADKLVEELGKLRKTLERQKNMNNMIKRQLIRDLLEGRKPAADKLQYFQTLDQDKNNNYIFILIRLDMPYPVIAYDNGIHTKIVSDEMWERIEFPEKIFYIDTLTVGDNVWGMLLKTSALISQRQIWEKIYSVINTIQKSIKEQYGESVTIVPSNLFTDLNGLPTIYKEAGRVIQYSIYEGKGKVLRFHDINLYRTFNPSDLRQGIEAVEKHLEELDTDRVLACLDDLFSRIISNYYEIEGFKTLCHELVGILNRFRVKNHIDTMETLLKDGKIEVEKWCTAQGIRQWFMDEFKKVILETQKSNIGQYSKKVQQIINYIYEHFAEDISVIDLGTRFGMSGDYLRHIFKEETGQTVLDFITFVRIEKSKKLLKSGQYKIYEIADMVGYKTAQYFSQVFRRTLGIKPFEYAEGRIYHSEN